MGQRELAVIFGILGVFLAPAIAEGLGYEGLESKVTAASGFLFICFAVFTPLTLWFAPDDPSDLRPPPIDLATARSFVTSRRFLLVSIANLSTSFAMVAMSVLSYFIAAYVFESSDRYGMAMTGYFIAAALGMSLWMRLSKRIGDRRTLMVAAAYITVALMLTPVLISFDGAWRYPFYTALLGVGFGAPPYLIRSLIGTLANAHEEATGEGVRGTAYAVTTFFDKLGSGFAAGIVLPLVGWIGFDPVGGGGEAGRMALLLVGTITPILGFGVAVVAAIRARDAARA
jgi:Na+/melibiose symporter-like transporter